MDGKVKARLDSIAEATVSSAFRVKEVPAEIRTLLTADGVDAPTHVRLNAVRPRTRRQIDEVVQQRFAVDYENKAIKSNAQIAKWAEERGEWSAEKQTRLEELQRRTTYESMRLWNDGFRADEVLWGSEILQAAETFRQHVDASTLTDDEKSEAHRRFDRWAAYYPFKQAVFDEEFGASQGTGKYSADNDHQWLLNHLPNSEDVELLEAVYDRKDKQERLLQLAEEKAELKLLQLKHARIFSGTAESRQVHNEAMAQLYFTCQRANAEGTAQGFLAPDFDGIWEFHDDVISWLLWESNFFHNDVPDEARSYLATFGFLKAEREQSPALGEKDSTAESPVPLSSSPATEPAVVTALPSSA